MKNHLFACGQHVRFSVKRFVGRARSGDYSVVKLLPIGDEEPRYEIKSAGEVYSRVAYEHQLSAPFSVFR